MKVFSFNTIDTLVNFFFAIFIKSFLKAQEWKMFQRLEKPFSFAMHNTK